jgi:hypothetical protein
MAYHRRVATAIRPAQTHRPLVLPIVCALVGLVALRAEDTLERAREVNLRFSASLPNFVADEHAERFKSSAQASRRWQLLDTIDSEISVKGKGGFSRDHTTVDGKSWSKPSLPPPLRWSVLFGRELKPLFDPQCHTTIEREGPSELRGIEVVNYRFDSPQDGCFGSLGIRSGLLSTSKKINPRMTGTFSIEEAGGRLVQFDGRAIDLPKGLESETFERSVSWGYVKTGSELNLLPVGMEIVAGSAKTLFRVVVTYKNHRHFEAATALKFEDSPQ